jgi:PAS domain S-box-containing protein
VIQPAGKFVLLCGWGIAAATGERAYATTRSYRGSVKRIHGINRDVRWCRIEGGGHCADRVSTMDTLNTLLEKLPAEDGERLKQYIEKQQKTEALHRELIRQLNQAMALNKVVLNAAGDGIVAVDENHTIIDFNPALAEMFGYTERELKGQKLELILPDEVLEDHLDGKRAFSEWPLARTADKLNGKKIYGLHKTKGPFRVSVAISQGLNEDEKIFSGIIRDLTHQDRLEKANEKQAQKLVNRAQELEGLYNLSKLLEEDSVPAIFEKLFKDIVPKTTTHPDTAVTIAELDGHTYRSGSEPPVVSLSSDLHNGKLTFGFTEDVPYGTARHQKLLDMFTAELDHIILRKKARQRELKIEREAAIGELESGVAHNVNNGLQIIQGYAQVALGLAETEEVREPLNIIRSKTRELGAMIRGVQQTISTSSPQMEYHLPRLLPPLRNVRASERNRGS